MSESQGNYDLALSRADHDMWFPVVSVSSTADQSVWDGGASTWDNDLTRDANSIWDASLGSVVQRHAIMPINGADKVAQQIKITLLAFLGEWFLDVTFGVPYLEEILVKSPRLAVVETILRAHINNVPHVIRLETFILDWDRVTRNLHVNFVAQTDYGRIENSVRLDTAAHV